MMMTNLHIKVWYIIIISVLLTDSRTISKSKTSEKWLQPMAWV